ncbi:heterokaryon incompatibility protein-domain-containing protein [Lophiotrema nucula]|uniref:Heterokaryon incompatibility protein-domain-containing protein n=1 Tax=Lophiotrema nucula TaxID=690887 RepID=A0A6A5YJ34_9PLEO|nr:heterokaryon incompatibility protein-domain-containing protein [Lophiotrema nucula]
MVYQYKPLDQSKQEIRLIVLDDGDKTRLKCKIITTSLDLYRREESPIRGDTPPTLRQTFARFATAPSTFKNRKPYHALSYVWGDPTPVCDIDIDGKMTKISRSLGDALFSIRTNTDYRVIWADALCINQRDNVEKSWQVQHMALIFARAKRVISWLGLQAEDSTVALKALQDLMHCLTSVDWKADWSQKAIGAPNAAVDLAETLRADPRIRTAIRSLTERLYWTRVWVFQELASARQNVFLCGDFEAEDIKFSLYFLELWSFRLSGIRMHVADQCGFVLTRFFHYANTHPRFKYQPPELVHILRSLASLDATDGRDKVFALLSVAKDSHSLNIIPDYDKDETMILIETTCALLRRRYVHYVLQDACGSVQRLGIPSWVPDWSAYKYTGRKINLFHPCQGREQSNLTLSSLPKHSLELKLHGYTVDVITEIADSFWDFCPEKIGALYHPSMSLHPWLYHLEEFLAASMTMNQDTIEELVARLLVGDVVQRFENERLGALSASNNPYTMIKNVRDPLVLFNWDSKRVSPRFGLEPEIVPYIREVGKNVDRRDTLFKTDTRMFGRSRNRRCKEKDIVVLLPSVKMPCILRRIGGKGEADDGQERYKLVEMAYVHGIMDGEFFEQNRNPEMRTFTLV